MQNIISLQTKTNTIELDLDLNATSPIILQGENGYSQKNHDRHPSAVGFFVTEYIHFRSPMTFSKSLMYSRSSAVDCEAA